MKGFSARWIKFQTAIKFGIKFAWWKKPVHWRGKDVGCERCERCAFVSGSYLPPKLNFDPRIHNSQSCEPVGTRKEGLWSFWLGKKMIIPAHQNQKTWQYHMIWLSEKSDCIWFVPFQITACECCPCSLSSVRDLTYRLHFYHFGALSLLFKYPHIWVWHCHGRCTVR